MDERLEDSRFKLLLRREMKLTVNNLVQALQGGDPDAEVEFWASDLNQVERFEFDVHRVSIHLYGGKGSSVRVELLETPHSHAKRVEEKEQLKKS